MRDPNRIPRIIAKFQQLWTLVPDWRMSQVFSNLKGAGRHPDIFFLEDGELEVLTDMLIKNYTKMLEAPKLKRKHWKKKI